MHPPLGFTPLTIVASRLFSSTSSFFHFFYTLAILTRGSSVLSRRVRDRVELWNMSPLVRLFWNKQRKKPGKSSHGGKIHLSVRIRRIKCPMNVSSRASLQKIRRLWPGYEVGNEKISRSHFSQRSFSVGTVQLESACLMCGKFSNWTVWHSVEMCGVCGFAFELKIVQNMNFDSVFFFRKSLFLIESIRPKHPRM